MFKDSPFILLLSLEELSDLSISTLKLCGHRAPATNGGHARAPATNRGRARARSRLERRYVDKIAPSELAPALSLLVANRRHPFEAERECRRYAAWPGQALSYKVRLSFPMLETPRIRKISLN